MCYQQYFQRQRLEKIALSLMILTVGGLIYVGWRSKSLPMFGYFEKLGLNGNIDLFREFANSNGIYDWVKFSLPDGLWLFSYIFLVDAIWSGYKSVISRIFVYSLPVFSLLSEFLQYWGLVPGTFDWIDVLSYTFAILLYITIKIIK